MVSTEGVSGTHLCRLRTNLREPQATGKMPGGSRNVFPIDKKEDRQFISLQVAGARSIRMEDSWKCSYRPLKIHGLYLGHCNRYDSALKSATRSLSIFAVNGNGCNWDDSALKSATVHGIGFCEAGKHTARCAVRSQLVLKCFLNQHDFGSQS
jgi:hypothetical protein